MALALREKELVAVGASVAAGCKPCTHYHLQEVRKTGASDAEIRQAIAQAARIRRDAAEIMEGHALERLGASGEIGGCSSAEQTTRIKELVSAGAAFAVNCTSSLEKHLQAGRQVGIAEEEIREVAGLAAFIQRMAASHAEKLVGMTEAGETTAAEQASASGCRC
jgi:AhpD family alkylhydroperoxidase